MRVLGIDPGLTRCGVGVVEGDVGRPLSLVDVNVLRTSADVPVAHRLVTIAPTCALVARPLPDTAAFTSLGVCNAIGSPRRAATTNAIPLAWAVPMTVLESERAKTRSTATASGR